MFLVILFVLYYVLFLLFVELFVSIKLVWKRMFDIVYCNDKDWIWVSDNFNKLDVVFNVR